MKPDRQAIHARTYSRRVLAALPEYAKAEFVAALSGAGSGHAATTAAPHDMLGPIAVALYLARVEPHELRSPLVEAWKYSHRSMINAAQAERQSLTAMYRYAAFPAIEDLPDQMTIWRGAYGVNLHTARGGYAWSLTRDMACWWATVRGGMEGGTPIVVRREVTRDQVVFFDQSPGRLSELIIDAPAAGEVDGTELDWREAARRWQAAKTAVDGREGAWQRVSSRW